MGRSTAAAATVSALLLALGPVIGTAAITQQPPFAIVSLNGSPGGVAGISQGADQGEDQGENLYQYSVGGSRGGPALVKAANSITSGSANGGAGGNVTAIFNNYVTTRCDRRARTSFVSPVPVDITSGNGGDGGVTGSAQGADQGEDQGENIAQRSTRATFVAPARVLATNRITSGHARGGNGGRVDLTFNQYTLCIGEPSLQTPPLPSFSGEQYDAGGNITAIVITHTRCGNAALQPFVIRAGDGGQGGVTGSGQGSDQGEDQGENIAQYAAGSSWSGATNVAAVNSLISPSVNGGNGRSVRITFENFVDGSCGSEAIGANATISVHTGTGGRGGRSGELQGTDQGEDQGENIGQFAAGQPVIGPVSVSANNTIISGDASGGNGGNVTVTYNDFGNCAQDAIAIASVDERVAANTGSGGQGGSSGHGQGADQAEDQGENIGQFATGSVFIGAVNVVAKNSTRSGDASGGAGGSVNVAFHRGNCSWSFTSSEGVAGSAGNGGSGGETGWRQGADQGEDQGENIGMRATASVRFGNISVRAVNRNIAGDALGGNGGDVLVASQPCFSGLTDTRVSALAGTGGLKGSSGFEQGSDQGEDHGENIAMSARASTGGVSVNADNQNAFKRTTRRDTGTPNSGCIRSAGQPASAPVPTHAVAEVTICRGALRGTAIKVQVPAGAICKLTNATIRHDVRVEAGGTLIASEITVGHDIMAYRARGLRVLRSKIAHSIISHELAGASVSNAVCGADVAHNILIEDSISAVKIGGAGCSGNLIGHDLHVYGNANAHVENNSAGHDAMCPLNRAFTGRGNRAPHINTCS